MYMNERETTPVIGTTKWPIHVAHIINKLYYAGKEVGIVKLLNGLNENYFHGLLIVMDPITEIVGLNTEKVELISLNKNPGNDLRIPFKLARIFKEKKVDIVHTHAWGTLVEGMIGAKMARVPVVIHGEHGTFHKTGKRRLVQNFLWKKADRLLSVSDVLARNLEQHIGLRKNSFETILNGVDTQRFRPDPVARLAVRKEWAIPKNRVVIGSVGRLAPVKNYPLLIEAAHLVIKKGYTPTFVIVGNNTDAMVKKDLIHQVASLGLKEHVRFVDKRGDIQRVMNAFDVFALTSFSEGCSNVIQEAMATGLPVVASRVGGNPELIRDGETGMLFTSNDKYELFDRLEKLILDKTLRRQLGRNACREAGERFSFTTMLQAYQGFYLNTLHQKGLWRGPLDSVRQSVAMQGAMRRNENPWNMDDVHEPMGPSRVK